MSGFALKRPARRHTLISVVSMIDVMMILLFFFMVTSSYLNLDMVPALQKTDEPNADPAPTTSTQAGAPSTVLIRIAPNGTMAVRGQNVTTDSLTALLKARLDADPLTPVVLFPSGGAQLQDLITAMDTVTKSGAVRVKVIRLGAAK
ncbi:MAG: biopolymer transporter ExbD [Paracoccaceae bacterium]